MIRLLDVLLSGTALVLLLPIFMPIALLLRATGEGEVFYRQERVGLNARNFQLIKFATMLKDSPSIGTGNITIRNDPRVLPVGHLLRLTKVNELPQLLNILLGDMSIIGPRPLTRDNFNMYGTDAQARIATVKPGLSGIGSIIFRDEERLLSGRENPTEFYREAIAPYKADLESWFVRNRNIRVYFLCIVLTIWVVIRPNSNLIKKFFPNLPPASDRLRQAAESIQR